MHRRFIFLTACWLGVAGSVAAQTRARDGRSASRVSVRADRPDDAVPDLRAHRPGTASARCRSCCSCTAPARTRAPISTWPTACSASSPRSTATSSSRRSASPPLGAYGNPLRLPAVFGESATAATQRAAVTPERRRELDLSELEVITALEIVTEEYGADRSRTFLAGHSMGSGGAWHLAARYPDRWRAVAPMSGPFIDRETYPFDRIRACRSS